jgi:hypothetical protein
MTHIFQFPSKEVQDWILVERGLLDLLDKMLVSEHFRRQILDRMKVVFDELEFDLRINVELSENFIEPLQNQINLLSADLSKHTAKIFRSRLEVEIELATVLNL